MLTNREFTKINCFYRCVIYSDIKDAKWLQQNLSDRNPAEELAIVGVTPDILGLQAPYKYKYTDYGLG